MSLHCGATATATSPAKGNTASCAAMSVRGAEGKLRTAPRRAGGRKTAWAPCHVETSARPALFRISLHLGCTLALPGSQSRTASNTWSVAGASIMKTRCVVYYKPHETVRGLCHCRMD